MAEQLKNTLAFNLAAGASVVIPHGLMTSLGVGLVPDTVFVPTDAIVVTADATNITLMNTGDTTAMGAVLVESWHTLERAFGDKAITKLTPQPFIVSSASAVSGMNFAPGRTLFVAQSWPLGADPLVYFTTISAAETQALTLTPTSANPVGIFIYTGTYTENVTHVSNVRLIGPAQNSVIVVGNISWLAGQGVNLGQAGATEDAGFNNISISGGTNVFTWDSTAKTGVSQSTLFFQSSQFNTVTLTGRGTGVDSWNANGSVFQNNNLTVTNINRSGAFGDAKVTACRMHGATWAGNTSARVEGGEFISAAAAIQAITGTAQVVYTGDIEVAANVTFTVAAGCKMKAAGCFIDTAISGAGDVDVRGCNFGSNADLTGITGTCLRTVWNTTVATGAGATVVPNAPLYPDGTYNVQLQLVAGPGNPAATVTAKLGASYTINDAVGGNTWDVTQVHD